ncbi:MAG: NAD(P)/FAD-dependent oxidoreductase [Nitrospinae bacterium]|nr:NAD(P)/FAD-dependent oxidoreductase [Nitrospinota bacterium]
MGKNIVILGGGVGGLVAANRLRQSLPHEHKIIIIERESLHTFAPSFLWVMTGDRKPEEITREVRQLVHDDIDVVHDEAKRIDIANCRVETASNTLSYDYLIVAAGAGLAPELIHGITEETHTFYTLKGSQKLHKALENFQGGEIAIAVSSLPYKCPGAPHEGAMLIADYFQRKGMRDKVNIHLFTPEPQPMPVAGPELGAAVRQMLESKKITFHPQHKLNLINSQTHELSFHDKEPAHYDLLIVIAPHQGPKIVREAGLSNEAGWIPVDRSTLRTKYENIYAVGDVAAISIPGRWKPDMPLMLPKAGIFAHEQAEVAARRIADEIHGRIPKAEFSGMGYCVLESGGGLAGFASGNFFAEPSPNVKLRKIGRKWHVGKVLFEQWWLSPFGARREILRFAINTGGKFLRIPASV